MTVRSKRRLFWSFLKWAAAGVVLLWTGQFLFTFVDVRTETRIIHARNLRLTRILEPSAFGSPTLTDTDFDVAPWGSVLVRIGDRLFEIPRGSHSLIDTGRKGHFRGFALDAGGSIRMLIAGFGVQADDRAVPVRGALSPFAGRLAGSIRPGSVLLFGGGKGDYRLYRAKDNGRLELLLRSPVPLVAATDSERSEFAATKSMIVRLGGRKPIIIFNAPSDDWGPIQSIAAADDGLIFFSTPEKVFVWTDGLGASIVNNSGGALRLQQKELFVFDAQRRLIYSLSPASVAMFARS